MLAKRDRLLFVWAALPLAVLLSAQAVAQSSGRLIPTNTELARLGLERAWWSQATINPARSTVRYLTLDEDNVYVQTSGGVITVFDSETGRKLWARQLGQRDEPSYAAVSNRDSVFLVVGLHLYSVSKFSGEMNWKLQLPKQPSTSPTVDDRFVYLGTLDGSVFAYDLRRIRELYEKNLLPEFSQVALRWRYQTGGEVISPPISTGRVVNFASRDGSLYSVGTESRRLQWQFETDATLSAPLAQSRGSIVMASHDYNVYCINVDNGALRWKPFVLGYPIRQQPRIIDDDIYLIALGSGLFCVSLKNGEKRWWYPNITRLLAATRDLLFLSDMLDNVVVLHRETGEFRGAIPLRRFSVRLSNDRTDRVYLSTPSGLVICLRQIGQEFPIYHMFPERHPIMPELVPEKTEGAEEESAAGSEPPAEP
ncbi:MAG TPA: pyrrolo-quinoline quinone [Planctomycetaceae bacterium]|nr:pyrrolo-quinoline quinone [Planctomycetaceae bacterium]